MSRSEHGRRSEPGQQPEGSTPSATAGAPASRRAEHDPEARSGAASACKGSPASRASRARSRRRGSASSRSSQTLALWRRPERRRRTPSGSPRPTAATRGVSALPGDLVVRDEAFQSDLQRRILQVARAGAGPARQPLDVRPRMPRARVEDPEGEAADRRGGQEGQYRSPCDRPHSSGEADLDAEVAEDAAGSDDDEGDAQQGERLRLLLVSELDALDKTLAALLVEVVTRLVVEGVGPSVRQFSRSVVRHVPESNPHPAPD